MTNVFFSEEDIKALATSNKRDNCEINFFFVQNFKMIKIREKNTSAAEHQNLELIEIAIASKNIPLQSENWSERYCCLPKQMTNYIEIVQKFPIREDDVFLITLPKCGTTWMQEAAWLLINNLNYEEALNSRSNDRCPYLEYVERRKNCNS